MNDSNLRPKRYTSEEAKIYGRKGGLARTPAKKWAGKLRDLRQKGLTDENYKWLLAKIDEPESFILDNLLWFESIKPKCTNPNQMILLGEALNHLYKLHHGEKIKTENVHHIIDWNQLWSKLLEDDDGKEKTKEGD